MSLANLLMYTASCLDGAEIAAAAEKYLGLKPPHGEKSKIDLERLNSKLRLLIGRIMKTESLPFDDSPENFNFTLSLACKLTTRRYWEFTFDPEQFPQYTEEIITRYIHMDSSIDGAFAQMILWAKMPYEYVYQYRNKLERGLITLEEAMVSAISKEAER